MASLITPQFERYVAEQTIARGTVQFDEFIFANIPGLNENNLAQYLTMPTSAQIVHRQAVSQSGVINENAVVYSVTIGTEVGDFDFNFIGLINRSKNLLAVAVQTDTVKKIRNKNAVQGNSITRNMLLEFSGAKALTGINVNANTWQIDFTVRLHGLDEKIRLTNRDLYGRAVFFDDSFLVKRKTGNQFTIQPGTAYVEGVRMDLGAEHHLTANSLPCSIYADVVHHCTVTGEYQTEIKYLTQSKADYLDTANRQHYVQILADIDSQGNVTDRRLLSPFLGMNPLTLDDTTENTKAKLGHTHKLPIASLVKKGIVKLFSGYDSDAEDMAATPKAIKGLKALIDAITRNLGNYIPNSKKSSAVDSNSADTVATSAAVKTAYDKGVEAEELANTKWTAKPATETEPGILPISHKTDGADKNKFASEYAVGEAAKKGLPLGAVVSFPRAVTNPVGFLRADGSTFNAQTFSDLYRTLGNSNKLPDLTRSDVGMTAYFAVDNIPAGWIAFDEIATQVTEQRYPELYRHLVGKYGSIERVPKVADRFLRNAGNGLSVGQTQEDEFKRHVHKHIEINTASDPRFYNDKTFDYDSRDSTDRTSLDIGTALRDDNDDNWWITPNINSKFATGGAETRPKSLILKLCIKAINSFDDVVFWIKSHGEVTNAGALDAGRLAQGLQDKAERNHTHTVSQITDFNQSVREIVTQSIAQNLAETGWCKLPNGMILQWGLAVLNRGYGRTTDTYITFPIRFPSSCFNVVMSYGVMTDKRVTQDPVLASLDQTGVTVRQQSDRDIVIYWRAIGV
ncbi:phage tail-collar fiber domain-containing protein [Haemophilus influenzae]|uniref:phage tail-collar fiber domain-containing protein n=4 Tax=Haemophilus influenzae TaxID=727 RepID=UPI0006650F63|nr:phage tail protein [Haemophilus influenzae]KPH68047.1 phage tail protein [Haemophilus influenzae]MCK8822493.1 phage tail protein [Haemophilus influenzae]MCK8847451.1 phage tail protein [Haemophilus influenzae]MCK8917704.1 phage tail protein [Haemophilus influenzae]MCK8963516.1 phage tail protein [Haemophilus influenzae]